LQGVRALAQALGQGVCRDLETLDLRDNYMYPQVCHNLRATFLVIEKVLSRESYTALKLGEGRLQTHPIMDSGPVLHLIPLQGAEALAVCLASGGVPKIRAIALSRNRIYGEVRTLLLNCVMRTSAHQRAPRCSWASGQGSMALAEALRLGACPLLAHLDLRGNKMCGKGAAAIAEVLRSGACPNLEVLSPGCPSPPR
jgi:hypothetical protein